MKHLIHTFKIYIQKYIVSVCNLAIALFVSISVSVYADSIQLVSPASDQNKLLGAYLSQAGNCMGCHTAKYGVSFAGGRKMYTSFGIFITVPTGSL